MMDIDLRPILLTEDDPRDVELTWEAMREHHLANRVVVARDGAETLDSLRASTKAGAGPDLRAAYELGAIACVVKPVGFGEFMNAVRQVDAFWALLNEPALVGQQ